MAKSPKAPTKAPTQVAPTTGEGVQGKTAPTFNQNPGRTPNPASQQVKVISDQHQPPRKGPATGRLDAQQQQQGD